MNINSFLDENKKYKENTERFINTPSSFAVKNLFYMQETGHIYPKNTHFNKRRDLNSYLLVCVLKGRGTLFCDNQNYELKAGQCFFIKCLNEHWYKSDEIEKWELVWVHFNGNVTEEYFKQVKKNVGSAFTSPFFSEIVSSVSLLSAIYEKEGILGEFELSNILTQILTYLVQSGNRPYHKNMNIVKIKEYIDENFFNDISLEKLSANFFISKFFVAREFKKYYGISVQQYIIKKRLELSKQLLRFSNATNEEIAIEIGIQTPNYFNKLFLKYEGCTPGEYKRKWKG